MLLDRGPDDGWVSAPAGQFVSWMEVSIVHDPRSMRVCYSASLPVVYSTRLAPSSDWACPGRRKTQDNG